MNQRTIKFRAWSKEHQRMSYLNARDFAWLGENALSTEKDKYTVMQFTGSVDKTGKEIYEGDIVKYSLHRGKNLNYQKRKVVWSAEKVGFNLKAFNKSEKMVPLTYKTMELLGNIYENPELIK